ncbi:unnamed protein product [Rhodiola kirilowii]
MEKGANLSVSIKSLGQLHLKQTMYLRTPSHLFVQLSMAINLHFRLWPNRIGKDLQYDWAFCCD